MRISDAIAIFDKYAGEAADSQLKYHWLQQIEDIIYNEVILTHENPAERPKPVLCGDRELLCPDAYAELYIHFLNMQNDLFLRDANGYHNNANAFVAAYNSYADWYNRANMPKNSFAVSGV